MDRRTAIPWHRWGGLGAASLVSGLLGGLMWGVWSVHQHRYLADGFPHLAWVELGGRIGQGTAVGLILAAVALATDRAFAGLSRRRYPASLWTAKAIQSRVGIVLVVAAASLSLCVFLVLSGWQRDMLEALIRRRGLTGTVVASVPLAVVGLMLRLEATRAWSVIQRMAVLASVIAISVMLGGAATGGTPGTSSRSVLLVTVDTLRADHLTPYGYGRNTSPRLEKLATRGRVFLNAYSHAPATGSSIGSIMTGQLPRQTGSLNNEGLPPGRHTLAEYLREAGYDTGAIVGNFVLRRGRGFEAGFASYDDDLTQREAVRGLYERTAEHTTRAALAWVKRHRGRPFFLWVHYQDPHGPYRPPERYRSLFDERESSKPLPRNASVTGERGIPSYQVLDGRFDSGFYLAQYDGEIRYVDDEFATLVSGLERLGLSDTVTIVLTADHGESMGELDYYFAHGEHLYPGLLHVPLLLWNDGSGCPGRNEAIVQHMDLAPTILSLAGLVPTSVLEGRDLRNCSVQDAEVLAEAAPSGRYQSTLVTRGIQVLYRAEDGQVTAFATPTKRQITDGRELARLGVESVVRRLRALGQDVRPQASETLSGAERDVLRSLGYVQ